MHPGCPGWSGRHRRCRRLSGHHGHRYGLPAACPAGCSHAPDRCALHAAGEKTGWRGNDSHNDALEDDAQNATDDDERHGWLSGDGEPDDLFSNEPAGGEPGDRASSGHCDAWRQKGCPSSDLREVCAAVGRRQKMHRQPPQQIPR